jgi:diguanylate cyclase (GGDEF)-like protein
VAVFLLAGDGESVRLRDAVGEGVFRGPLPSREGALGAVLAAQRPVRLEAASSLSYYEGRAKVASFCGVPLVERDGSVAGALIADREAPFSSGDERVLVALSAEAVRAIESERLLSAIRREKEEKQRFFHALEGLNRTTTVHEAAQACVAQAQAMCPALDLCAVTLAEGRRHRVHAVGGEGVEALADLSFADNAGLVSNVVKLGAPLPARAATSMERVVIFDSATVVRGVQSLRIFPLRVGDETVGTLVCGSRQRDAIEGGAAHELAMLALQAAEAIVRTRLYETAEKLATTDGLTGLLNRRTFNQQLEARVKEAQRYHRPMSLLLMDIDHFKKVNDTHGHPAGDAVLRSVAAIAQKQARETDVVARYGGEEMALILPETDMKGALAIAERIRKAVEVAAHAIEGGTLKVTLSIGVSTWPQGGTTEAELLESCDKALYRAKQSGRNRVELARTRAAA